MTQYSEKERHRKWIRFALFYHINLPSKNEDPWDWHFCRPKKENLMNRLQSHTTECIKFRRTPIQWSTKKWLINEVNVLVIVITFIYFCFPPRRRELLGYWGLVGYMVKMRSNWTINVSTSVIHWFNFLFITFPTWKVKTWILSSNILFQLCLLQYFNPQTLKAALYKCCKGSL